MTDPVASNTPAARPTGFVGVCLWLFAACFVVAAGGAYGVAAHQVLGRGFGGLMGMSFLAGVPLAIGLLVGVLARRRKLAGIAGASGLAFVAVALYVFAAGAFLREGVVCIVMASPLFLVLALVGGVIGAIASRIAGRPGQGMLAVALVLPVAAAPIEDHLGAPTLRVRTVESVHIDAPPSVVWHHINYPTDIRPDELRDGLAYRIGVPFPIEGRTLDERVGGLRRLQWQRGVAFDEVITAWEPERRIAWRYAFSPDAFPAGSLDDHIVIGGRYFNLADTTYTLTPENGGTRLSVDVGTEVTTTFNWYAGPWARWLVGDTARTILGFYKVRSETRSAS